MKGACPPNSNDRRFMVSVACFMRILPTSVEPVKDSLRTRSSSMMAVVMSGASSPTTTDSTPLGSPASSKTVASSRAVSGVSSEGLITMLQPAASAGANLRVIIAAGKFQGVMAAVTPTGRFSTRMRLSGELAGTVSP